MVRSRAQANSSTARRIEQLGPRAYLLVFAWSLGLILFAPPEKVIWAAGLVLLVSAWLFPMALKHIFNLRWLVILTLLILTTTLTAKPDTTLAGMPFSQAGLLAGLQMALRAVVIFVALDGLSSSLEISVLAGMIERLGASGLGFSIGVAMNLLPGLRQSIHNTWQSLWMRGGLRRQRWRALKYFLTTIMVNALRQGEEIALAAEARAYTPSRSRAMPVPRGSWDGWILGAAALSLALFFIL